MNREVGLESDRLLAKSRPALLYTDPRSPPEKTLGQVCPQRAAEALDGLIAPQ